MMVVIAPLVKRVLASHSSSFSKESRVMSTRSLLKPPPSPSSGKSSNMESRMRHWMAKWKQVEALIKRRMAIFLACWWLRRSSLLQIIPKYMRCRRHPNIKHWYSSIACSAYIRLATVEDRVLRFFLGRSRRAAFLLSPVMAL
jgi:hypothetical protein